MTNPTIMLLPDSVDHYDDPNLVNEDSEQQTVNDYT